MVETGVPTHFFLWDFLKDEIYVVNDYDLEQLTLLNTNSSCKNLLAFIVEFLN
jgi:hypothetical protein